MNSSNLLKERETITPFEYNISLQGFKIDFFLGNGEQTAFSIEGLLYY